MMKLRDEGPEVAQEVAPGVSEDRAAHIWTVPRHQLMQQHACSMQKRFFRPPVAVQVKDAKLLLNRAQQ